MKLDRPYEIEGPLSEELVYRIRANFEALFAFQLDLTNTDNIGSTILAVTNGGTGLNSIAIGDLLYGSAVNTLSTLGIGASGKVLRSNGTTPDWSGFTIPNTFTSGAVVYASSANVLAGLTIGSAGKLIRSTGTLPAWSTFTIPDTFTAGDISYASSANVLAGLTIGATGKFLRSTGTLPAWATSTISDTFAAGDIVYGSAANTLTGLTVGSAGKIIRSTGTLPAWSTFTIPDTFAQGSIPHASATDTLTALAKGSAGTYIRAGASLPAYSALLIGDFPAGGTWSLSGTALTLSGAGLLFSADNTYDIGAAGATRPRDLFVGRNVDIDGTLDVAGVSTLRASLLFAADASHDIGATGATRPRDIHLSRDLVAGDQLFERGRTTALGEWINVSYDSANFTASTGTWTVDSGDQVIYRYALVGKVMFLMLRIANTDVSTTGAILRVKIPGGFTQGTGQDLDYAGNVRAVDAGGTPVFGIARIAAGDDKVELYTSPGGGTWTATSGDNTTVEAIIIIDIA